MENKSIKLLRLPLKKKWFEMTKSGVKTEDYREINDYWCRRLLAAFEEIEWSRWEELIELLASNTRPYPSVKECMSHIGVDFKKFEQNVMTLGYPKNGDTERVITLEHKGIEIRTGNPEWGAEEGKLYFVILHGGII